MKWVLLDTEVRDGVTRQVFAFDLGDGCLVSTRISLGEHGAILSEQVVYVFGLMVRDDKLLRRDGYPTDPGDGPIG